MTTLKIWIRDILVLLASIQIIFHGLFYAPHPYRHNMKATLESVYGGSPEMLNQATFVALGVTLGFFAYFGQKASTRVYRAAIESQAIRGHVSHKKRASLRLAYRKMIHEQGHLGKEN